MPDLPCANPPQVPCGLTGAGLGSVVARGTMPLRKR